MAPKPRTYRKLAGSGFSAALRHSLWEGPDHLLWVESAIFQEQYRRFYFRDIETVVLHQTSRRTLWTLILGCFFLLFAAISVFSKGINWFSIFMAALLAILTAVQWLKGPGCKVYLQTAVQKYHLSNLVRMRKALKTLDRIRFLAEAAQGPVNEQGLDAAHFKDIPSETEKGESAADETPSRDTGTEDAAPAALRLQSVLYGLLFFFGLARGAQYWLKSIHLAVADMAVLVCTLVLVIIVLARTAGRNKGGLLSLSAWFTLVFSILHSMAAYGVFMATTMRSMMESYSNWTLLKNFFQLQVEALPVIEAITVGVALLSIGLGFLGIVGILTERPHRKLPKQEKAQ